jgi:hypothetical protein
MLTQPVTASITVLESMIEKRDMGGSLTRRRGCRFNLLPTVWALLDIRVITFGIVAVIPVTGWILLSDRRGLLDVDRRRYRYGDHGRIGIIGRIVRRTVVA